MIIYNLLIYLIQPIIWLRLLWLGLTLPAYLYRWSERYGFCQGKVKSGGILLHSVSLGETLSAVPLIYALHNRYPLLPMTVTTMTPSASQQVLMTFGKSVHHVYLPYDLPGAVTRFLKQVNPKLVIIMETEVWPNLIKALHHRNVPIFIVNARLSAQSAAGYKRFYHFFADIMRRITLIIAKNEEDGARLLELGLKKNQLVITSNLKFDVVVTPDTIYRAAALRLQWALNRPVWIATSTHKGEENLLLESHRRLLVNFPKLLLILVPRHPQRFSEVKKMIKKAGFCCTTRSSKHNPDTNTQVVLGDTVGELMILYGIADLAFIGGSLVKHGGHNPLEAAAHAIPILMGPYTLNFFDICEKLHKAGALITVTNITTLVDTVSILLMNSNFRLSYGKRAMQVIQQNRGVLTHILDLIHPYLLK